MTLIHLLLLANLRLKTSMAKLDKYSNVKVECDIGKIGVNKEFQKVSEITLNGDSNTESGVNCKREILCVLLRPEDGKSLYYKTTKKAHCFL